MCCETCAKAIPSLAPSIRPSLSAPPSVLPTGAISTLPSLMFSAHPSLFPSSAFPTKSPTLSPSFRPTKQPSRSPSHAPSVVPTSLPSLIPSQHPSDIPSAQPSLNPSNYQICDASELLGKTLYVYFASVCWRIQFFENGALDADTRINVYSCSEAGFSTTGNVSTFKAINGLRAEFDVGSMGWKGSISFKENPALSDISVGLRHFDVNMLEFEVDIFVLLCTKAPSIVPSTLPTLVPSTQPSPINYALGKPTTQSSTHAYFGGASSRAVDGNTSTLWGSGSVTLTELEANPFWSVDLESTISIRTINVYNRMDCCSYRLTGFKVVIYNGSSEVWTYTDTNGTPPALTSISVPNVDGDKVEVKLEATDYLSLAEVQVFGTEVQVPSLHPTEQLCVTTACGRNNICTSQTTIESSSTLRAVRCCSDVALPNFDIKTPDTCPDIWARQWAIVGDVSANDACELEYGSRTYFEARSICAQEGARLCTVDEMTKNCAVATGCRFDNKKIWTSDVVDTAC